MLRWEKLPILGENPVFCYELWRSWRGRTAIWLLLIMLGIVLLSIVIPETLQGTFRRIGLWQAGPGLRSSPAALARWMGVEAAIESRSPDPTQTGHYCNGYLMLLLLKWPVGPATRYLVAALAAVMMGLRVGASSWRPAVAMGAAIFAVAVVLPIACACVQHAVALAQDLRAWVAPDVYIVPWSRTYAGFATIYIAFYGIASIALTLSTWRALGRAAE